LGGKGKGAVRKDGLERQQHTNTAVQTYNNAATGTCRVNIQLLRHTTSTSKEQDYIIKAEWQEYNYNKITIVKKHTNPPPHKHISGCAYI
jgi:hypothetical protein